MPAAGDGLPLSGTLMSRSAAAGCLVCSACTSTWAGQRCGTPPAQDLVPCPSCPWLHTPYPAAQTFAEKLAKLQAAEGGSAPPAEFSLNFLWLDKNIAVAVDQVFAQVRAAVPAGGRMALAFGQPVDGWRWRFAS